MRISEVTYRSSEISWLSTPHSPICAHCMSSLRSNPALFILTVFAPITSFGTGREDVYPSRRCVCVCVCVHACVGVWVSEGYKADRGLDGGTIVGSRKLAKRGKVRGESRMAGLCCRCHSVATQLPWHLVLAWCYGCVYVCMHTCVML